MIIENEELWKSHCEKKFPKRINERKNFESWRILFIVIAFCFFSFFFLFFFLKLHYHNNNKIIIIKTSQIDKEEAIKQAEKRLRESNIQEVQGKNQRFVII